MFLDALNKLIKPDIVMDSKKFKRNDDKNYIKIEKSRY